MSDFSSILFARPSFMEGMGRIFDFGNFLTEYNQSLSGEQADRLAAYADWGAVAKDIQDASRAAVSVKKIAKR